MTRRAQALRLLFKEGVLDSIVPKSRSCIARQLSTANPNTAHSEEQSGSHQGRWSHFTSSFGSGSKDERKKEIQEVAQRVWNEVKNAVMPKSESLSPTRVRTDATPINESTFRGPSHIVAAKRKETLVSKLMDRLHKQFGGNPVYKRLRGLTDQGKEMAEDFKDRMEASDHPMVHKIQDYHESFTKEGEAAQVMREILKRDSAFNMVNFLRSVKEDVPVVVKAYLEGKEDVLQQHCTKELLEKLMGLYRHSEAQGTFQDSTLLFIDDVEMLDAMFVEKQPVIVVTFSCQQINCMRDKFGNVIEGKEDEIQQVYYAWALQQDEHGAFDVDGKLLPPRWQLREMMIRGFHALL